ncbi:MAG: type VI secretion system lipoprotein TssJ [Saccharospirillum sp.]|nr:type VI secretion system lipoprotein TssJ [Saccharospirillum sp.]
MKREAYLLRVSLIGLMVALISACSTPHLNYTIHTDGSLNPDSTGNNYAVLVRVYQLTVPDSFNTASFDDLWRHSDTVLSGTLLAQHEITLEPGESRTWSLRKENDARYTGVVAFFRDSESAHWKQVRKVNNGPIPASTELHLHLIQNQLELSYR